MNPNSLAANLLSPQTINKNTNNLMMVGMNLAQTGPQIPPPSILPPTVHPMGPMGEHGMVMQSTMNSVAPSSIAAPLSSPKQSHATPNGGCALTGTPCGGTGGNNSIQSTATMANMKEKTPMCLINELARFNKVQHQYRLVDESGPPHKKTFTVVLKLDNEEYTASGPSIKKAQHAAAAIALEQTQMKHPPPKTSRKTLGPITPTVELNALAMKRGEPAIYQLVEPQRPQYIPNLNFRGMYHQRYHYPKTPVYCVSLKVGSRIYFGEGRTSQAARHAAAEEALAVLRTLPCPEGSSSNNNNNNSNSNLNSNIHKKLPEPPVPKLNGNVLNESEEDDDLKSPISLVHEIALKRGLSVNFEVVRETGPPHMRNFITKCSVGDIVSEGEGNGKKVSKKRAAEKMIEELRKLPPLPPVQQKVKKKPVIKKKNRNLIKEQKADPQYGQGINPISRLIQIQQAKKEREPVYTVIDERGEPRQREFLMQCSLGDISTTGTGPNKKTAKRNAAEAMLQRMGYSRPAVPQNQSKTPMKNTGIEVQQHMYSVQDSEKGRKVTFSDHNAMDKIDSDGKLGRQLVPGLLLMPDSSGLNPDPNSLQTYQPLTNSAGLNRAPGGPIQTMNSIALQTSAIAKELLDSGVSPTADALRMSGHKPVIQHQQQQQQPSVRPKQQLLYLADVLGFQARFTDFPKHNEREHFSLVTLTTQPPLIRHGAGPTIEASHDQAALIALRSLAEIGLEAVTESSKKDVTSTNLGSGDRMYMAGGQGTAPKLTNSSVSDLGNNPKTGQTIPVVAKDSH